MDFFNNLFKNNTAKILLNIVIETFWLNFKVLSIKNIKITFDWLLAKYCLLVIVSKSFSFTS